MKKLYTYSIIAITLFLFLSSCVKNDEDEHYTVTFKKEKQGEVKVEINEVPYTFDGDSFTQEVDVKWPSSLDAHTSVMNGYDEQITISVLDNKGKFIGEVIDAGYVYILASEYKIYGRSTDNNSSSSSSSGSHLCGYTTQAGTPCKNRVSNKYTYCWRHR